MSSYEPLNCYQVLAKEIEATLPNPVPLGIERFLCITTFTDRLKEVSGPDTALHATFSAPIVRKALLHLIRAIGLQKRDSVHDATADTRAIISIFESVSCLGLFDYDLLRGIMLSSASCRAVEGATFLVGPLISKLMELNISCDQLLCSEREKKLVSYNIVVTLKIALNSNNIQWFDEITYALANTGLSIDYNDKQCIKKDIFFHTSNSIQKNIDYLQSFLNCAERIGIGFGERDWGNLAKSAVATKKKDVVLKLWEICCTFKAALGPDVSGAFATEAAKFGSQEVLQRVVRDALTGDPTPGIASWGAFAKASSALDMNDLLEEVWGSPKKPFLAFDIMVWGTFAKAAILVKNLPLFKEIWQTCSGHSERLGGDLWSPFVTEASLVGEVEIFTSIAEHAIANAEKVGSASWAALATGTGAIGNSGQLEELWQWAGRHFNSVTLGSFVTAASKLDAKNLLRDIWQATAEFHHELTGYGWGSFVTAAAKVNETELLKEMWNETADIRHEMTGNVWGSFVTAAAKVNETELLKEMWIETADIRQQFNAAAWGSFVTAAAKLDAKELLRQIWQASADIRHEMTGGVWGSFVTAAAKINDTELIKEIWQATADIRQELPGDGWGSFVTAAAKVSEAELLKEMWNETADIRQQFNAAAWGSFITAAAKLDAKELLRQIWQASADIRHEMTGDVWGSFVTAAGKINDSDLLKEMWRATADIRQELPGDALGSFVTAAAKVSEAELLKDICHATVDSPQQLNATAWGSAATAAAEIGDANLLSDIFAAWTPQPNSLMCGEHALWGSFLSAAVLVEREDILEMIFRKLESYYDPTRLPHRGTLQPLLMSISNQVESPDLARFIARRITGADCDVPYCLEVLRTHAPAADFCTGGQFEGAARCLSRFIINSFFFDDEPLTVARLAEVSTGFASLDANRRMAALTAFFTRGQECYFGCIRSNVMRQFKYHLFGGQEYDDAEWRRVFRDGTLASRIRSLKIDQERPGLPNGVITAVSDSVDALAQHLIRNQLDFIRQQKKSSEDARVEFFKLASDLVYESFAGRAPDYIGRAILRIVDVMAAGIGNEMFQHLDACLHEIRNQVMARIEASIGLSEEAEAQLCLNLFNYLNRMLEAEFGFHPATAVKPINIGRHAWASLVSGRHESPATICHPPGPWTKFNIAAWDGARDELILRIFREIRRNVEVALAAFPPDEQLYRLSLEAGSSDDEGFGILTVENIFLPGKEASPFSTRKGKTFIKRIAETFRQGDRVGGAYSWSGSRDDGHMWHKWEIYLPLFIPENT